MLRQPGLRASLRLDFSKQMHPAMLEDRRPLQVIEDGNCFYRALSRALYGHEEFHLLLRLLILLEIGLYPRLYDYERRSNIDLIKDVRIVVSKWRELLLATASVGGYAEMLHFFAASAVLQLPLYSYCPPSSNPYALSDPHTRIVRGSSVGGSKQYEYIIMWSMMHAPRNIKAFVPDHFVVLSQLSAPGDFVDLTDSKLDDYPPLQSHASATSLTPPVLAPYITGH